MISELPNLLPDYPGDANHTRCFNHTVALVAVRVVRQFDVPSARTDDQMDEAEQELQALAEGMDIEEEVTQQEREGLDGEDDDNDMVDWEDERAQLFMLDREDLDENTRPIRLLLVKVSVAFCIVKVLPQALCCCSYEKYLLHSSTLPHSFSLCGSQLLINLDSMLP